jgi:hypothetical protein
MEEEAGKIRADRREEIKLRLEYIKLVVSAFGAASILFAALQWTASNQAADHAVYQRMSANWTSNLETFIKIPRVEAILF